MKPIIYSATVQVRFSDLDPYGHVNSARYLDYVISSRFQYSLEHLDVTDQLLISRGVGFFLTRAESSFHRPVVGVQKLLVTSWVSEIEGARLTVPYEIKLPSEKLANSGTLHFAVMDLKTQRPTEAPEWVVRLFRSAVS